MVNNILYHDSNKKGKDFENFYQYYTNLLGNNRLLPNKIIFTDDKIDNISFIRESLNLQFYGYYINNIFPFNLRPAYVK
ncbi:MAG: hypothetical protein EOP34_05160 [Rickettsiales bacterium]|nr:MAG: hypothetical protein EOP34_05160 [Rickettsiales bacterium]